MHKALNKYLVTLCLFLCIKTSYSQVDTTAFNITEIENYIVEMLSQKTEDSTTTSSTHYPFLLRDSIVCYAETFLGTPYHYGSKGPSAFDCSGFTSYVFSHFNIQLASSSTAQYKESLQIVPIDSAQIGDLIFFMGRNGRSSVGHVGIIVDVDTANCSCRFIHAATHGGVIITNFPAAYYYNPRFMGIGRYNLPEFVNLGTTTLNQQ